MARIVSEDIFDKEPTQRVEKYPYDEWTDGKPRVFVRGVDFDAEVKPEHFGIVVRRGFARRGFRARVSVLSDREIAIQAIDDTP